MFKNANNQLVRNIIGLVLDPKLYFNEHIDRKIK